MRTLHRILGTLFLIGFWLVLPFVLCSCSTIIPKTVDPVVASYDGNEQNSGVISSNANGYVVTAHFRDRYNALVAVYGRDFTVPVKADDGMSPIDARTWLIDRQHLAQFLEMQAWSRAKAASYLNLGIGLPNRLRTFHSFL